jgi:hypothetical protein
MDSSEHNSEPTGFMNDAGFLYSSDQILVCQKEMKLTNFLVLLPEVKKN